MTDQPNPPAGKLLQQWRFLGYVLRHPRRPRKSATAGAVAWYLLERFDAKKGRAWPSLDTIARDCNAPRSSVAEAIDWLLKEGLFEKVAGGGRGHSNAYRPCLETIRISGPIDEEPSEYPVQNSPDIRHETVRVSGPNTSYPRVDPRSGGIEVSSPGAAAPPAGGGGAPSGRGVIKTPEGFEDLWSAWPRHEWRRQAIVAYAAVVGEGHVDQPTLLTKAREYAAHVATVGTKPGLVRGLHTWLEGQGWLETPNVPPIKEPKPKQVEKPAASAKHTKKTKPKGSKAAAPAGSRKRPGSAARPASAPKTSPACRPIEGTPFCHGDMVTYLSEYGRVYGAAVQRVSGGKIEVKLPLRHRDEYRNFVSFTLRAADVSRAEAVAANEAAFAKVKPRSA